MGALFLSYTAIDGAEFGFEKSWSFSVIPIYFVLVVIKYLTDFKDSLMNGIMYQNNLGW